jgi:type II secretory pathway component PulK
MQKIIPMKRKSSLPCPAVRDRKGERGAALISTLLFSMLLLTAGGALLMSTGMSANNAFDSTAEIQAYYAAESGMQATLVVLRNVTPKVTFVNAVSPTNSNAVGDAATTAGFRRY